jgi:hypothetical protein
MSALDRVLAHPSLVERHYVDVSAAPEQVWACVRHLDLARSPFTRVLFALRTLPDRFAGRSEPLHVRIDDLVSSAERPGFRILIDDPPREVAAGAIGKCDGCR